MIELLTYSIGSLQNDWVFSKGRDRNSRKSIQVVWRKHYILLKGNDCLYAESEKNKRNRDYYKLTPRFQGIKSS
jgi:hypothetical protein